MTIKEAVKELQSMRNCLNPLFIKWGHDGIKDEALRVAILLLEKEYNKMQLQYMRSKQRLYLMDNNGNVITDYECRSDFVDGYNSVGQPRETLPNGDYFVNADYPGDDLAAEQGAAYGTFYIHTGDYRYRDIHGGGSGLHDPFAPYQGWVPTYGCLRMQNADGEEVSRWIIDNGNNMLLEVVD